MGRRPYSEDLLDRNEKFAEGIWSLIGNSSKVSENKSLVLAIDSGWGTGKTWLLDMMQNNIPDDYQAFNYNAWESDDWSNALIPIVAQIKGIHSGKEQKKDFKEELNEVTTKLGVFLENHWKGLTVNILARNLTKFDFTPVIDKWNEVTKEIDLTKEYDDFVGAKNKFKEVLKELSSEEKIIFFIDELDRCKPTFAIETLEVVKHLFDIENYVFIFALDMQQLSHSVATVYGQNMDSAGYLRRFFDMQLRIPSPALSKYIDHIVTDDLMTENSRLNTTIEDIRNNIRNIFDKLYLTLRDINIVYSNFLIFVRYHNLLEKDNAMRKFYLYLFLFTIKYKKPSEYQLILHQKYRTGELNKDLVKLEYEILPEIKDFLFHFSVGNMQKPISELETHKKQYLDNIKLLDYESDERVYQFLERQLEIISIG